MIGRLLVRFYDNSGGYILIGWVWYFREIRWAFCEASKITGAQFRGLIFVRFYFGSA